MARRLGLLCQWLYNLGRMGCMMWSSSPISFTANFGGVRWGVIELRSCSWVIVRMLNGVNKHDVPWVVFRESI